MLGPIGRAKSCLSNFGADGPAGRRPQFAGRLGVKCRFAATYSE